MRYTLLPVVCAVMLALTAGCASNRYQTKIAGVRTLLRDADFSQAQQELAALVEAYPDSPEPYYLYGTYHYLRGNYAQCLSYFDRAERLGYPEGLEYLTARGIALYMVGDFVQSKDTLERSLAAGSTPAAHKYLGMIHYMNKDYSAAAEALSRSLPTYSKDDKVLSLLGTSRYETGDVDGALAAFLSAYAANPQNEKVAFSAAQLLMLTGRYADAADIYGAIPADSPLAGMSMFNKAEAEIGAGRYQPAVETLTGYLSTHPQDFTGRYNLAAALMKTGNFQQAAEILSNLRTEKPADIRISFNLSLACQHIGANEQSLVNADFAAKRNPDNADYQYAYAVALERNNRLEEAAGVMSRVLALDSSNENAREWLDAYRATAPEKEGD